MNAEGSTSVTPEKGTPWKLIVFGVVAVYAILIVLFNLEEVEVSFVLFSATISKLVLIASRYFVTAVAAIEIPLSRVNSLSSICILHL